ncbi:MAG: restriction endonuclease subunit S [Lachnospiraceae bacterium]|nr:restriction endonuclease subunit S [Lachnospiraceae bacterium]
MSKLNELIQKLSPNGIEYKFLNEVAHYARERVNVTEINPETYVGVENLLPNKAGKTIARYVPTEGNVIAFHVGDILIGNIRPYLRKIWLADCEGGTNGDVLVVHLNGIVQIFPKFLYYVMSSEDFFVYDVQNSKGAKMPRGDKAAVLKYKVPVPPLEIQYEIVRILDNFTELAAELTVKLTAELIVRKKQYEYYREMLLALKFDFVYLTLDEISENCDRQRKPVTKGNRTAGKYPYYGASGVVDYVSDYIFDGDYLLVSEDGANLLTRNTPIAFSISGKTWVNNHAHVLKFDSYELRRYVEIYLNSIDLSKYISGGAQPKLNQDNLNKILIPVPGNERMKYIVNILDRYDAICNDLTSDLSAEIEARQKQYEYFRDKLLSFEEVK